MKLARNARAGLSASRSPDRRCASPWQGGGICPTGSAWFAENAITSTVCPLGWTEFDRVAVRSTDTPDRLNLQVVRPWPTWIWKSHLPNRVRATVARSSSFQTQRGSEADRAGGPLLLPTIRRRQAGSDNRPIGEDAEAPNLGKRFGQLGHPLFEYRSTLRLPGSGGLRPRYDEILAAAIASRRPTTRRRLPPLRLSPGPVGAPA